MRLRAPRAGGNDFKLLIDDLCCGTCCIKYVDDVTIVNVSSDPLSNQMQLASVQLFDWCKLNKMNLNVRKTKEMIFHFGKNFDVKNIPLLNHVDILLE